MIALLLLAAIGTAIVVSRLVLNGNREPRGFAAGSAPAPAVPTGRRAVRRGAAAPESLAAGWPGGPCPSCGNETYAGAKFCGECGQRLATDP